MTANRPVTSTDLSAADRTDNYKYSHRHNKNIASALWPAPREHASFSFFSCYRHPQTDAWLLPDGLLLAKCTTGNNEVFRFPLTIWGLEFYI